MFFGNHKATRIVIVGLVILVLVPALISAVPAESQANSLDINVVQQATLAPNFSVDYLGGGAFDDTVFRYGPKVHRWLGYATLAGATVTGVLGWLGGEDLHETVAVVTTGFAVATTGAGVVTHVRDGDLSLGQLVLSGLGTIGFLVNLNNEVDDDELGLHQIFGTASASTFALSVVWVITL